MEIPEDEEVSNNVKAVKPLPGIHVQKLTPLIQDLDYIYTNDPVNLDVQKKNRTNAGIWISKLLMPTNDYIQFMWQDVAWAFEKDDAPDDKKG